MQIVPYNWMAAVRQLFAFLSVQIAFTVVVFPCLLLAYSGQAAYLIQHQENVDNVFYRSIPSGSLHETCGYLNC